MTIERRETGRLPRWANEVLTAEQRDIVRRRFGLIEEEESADDLPARNPGEGGGGGTPAPAAPSVPAWLTMTARREGRR